MVKRGKNNTCNCNTVIAYNYNYMQLFVIITDTFNYLMSSQIVFM